MEQGLFNMNWADETRDDGQGDCDGIMGYERKLKKENEGNGMIHRPETEGKLQRRMDKFCGKTKWFRREKKDDVAELNRVRGRSVLRQYRRRGFREK